MTNEIENHVNESRARAIAALMESMRILRITYDYTCSTKEIEVWFLHSNGSRVQVKYPIHKAEAKD